MTYLNESKRFALISTMAVMLLCSTAAEAQSPMIGQMAWVSGTVQAIGSETRSLQRRSPIYEDDTIVTGKSGSGQIVFTDSSTVSLRSNTTFHVDKYKYSPGSDDNTFSASLAKGGFRTITGLISKTNPANYSMHTPVATIGVRGTDYTVFYGGAGLSVMLNRGAVVLSNPAGQVQLSTARNRVYAEITGIRSAPVVTTRPAPTLLNTPPITPSTPPPVPPSSTATSVTTPSNVNAAPQSQTISAPSSATKNVAGFCVN